VGQVSRPALSRAISARESSDAGLVRATAARTKSRQECLLHYGKVSDMAISKELLEILVCPLCKAPVRLTPDNSGLKCEKCKRVYPIKDDIPVMLVDEAKIEA
jgi:hypothetical protein